MTMIGDEKALIDTIRKRQRKCIGNRLSSGVLLLRTAIQWKMDGKKTRNNSLPLWFYNNFYFTLLYFTHQLALFISFFK